MKFKVKPAAAAMLTAALVVSCAYASDPSPAPQAKKHHAARREKTPPGPTVEEQIETLRNQMQTQIDSLKELLSTKDQQLQQAQQAAAAAQAAAEKAQAAADQQQQAITQNTTAVSTLQSSVNDLDSSSSSMESSFKAVQRDTTAIKKAVENTDAVHYKGVTITPAGSFIEAATVWRNAATGSGINTHFTAIPLEHSGQAQIDEFHGSARQSRIALTGTAKAGDIAFTVHYEMDWLGTGITSNNNQSNSYVVRVRNMWARAALDDGWAFTGGQTWSLATETTHHLAAGTEILPGTIDPQYTAGFVWGRQYAFRVTKDWDKRFAAGVALENAQALPAGSNPTNEFLGAAGDGGGLYNSTANYSYNTAPDIIAKMAYDGWGHWELFGIARFFNNRIYPNASAGSSAGAYNDTVTAGGIGGGIRMPFAGKKVSLGLKGLYSDGVGRYGDSGIADLTFRSDGTISLIHAFSALGTFEVNPTKRLSIWSNYGGDYVGRDIQNGGASGYGLYSADMSGCNTEGLPGGDYTPATTGNCKGNNKDVQEFSLGYWYNFYKGPKGNLRYGLQYSWFERDLWSGIGGPLNPNGGANGTDNELETSFRYYMP
ncbi:MAG: hypothetical protein ACRD3N_11370 [Terracidiphilus sp.]